MPSFTKENKMFKSYFNEKDDENMKKDLSGNTYGTFHVISFSHRNKANYMWLCECTKCKENKLIDGYELRSERRLVCKSCKQFELQKSRREDVKYKFLGFIDIKTNGCWIWNGFKDKDGYGICWRGYYNQRANRTSYWIFNGDFPKEKWILHKCDNPSCVNPDHLYLGDVRQNVKDALERGRFPKGANIKKGRVGENNHKSKLTSEQVKSIRQEYIPFIRNSQTLAKKYGVSASCINRIVKGDSWKCV